MPSALPVHKQSLMVNTFYRRALKAESKVSASPSPLSQRTPWPTNTDMLLPMSEFGCGVCTLPPQPPPQSGKGAKEWTNGRC